ncbi:unnamed protein product [Penicillium pancosmium]
MSPDSKTKIRPQQSCVRCRERKVKCDRSRPCHACIIRGLEAECTYLATAEDHAQINQAEIIDRLRREVAQLRGQLSQGPRQAPSPGTVRRRHNYTRKNERGATSNANANASNSRNGYAGNRMAQRQNNAGGSENEGSWAGSSPSSSTTTMTNSNSVTMTSPDSTGSENGSTLFPYPAAGPYGTSIVAETEGAGAFGELAYSTMKTVNKDSDEVTVAYCQPELPTFGEIPASTPSLQGIVSQPIMHPETSQFQGISPMQLNGPYGDAQGYIPTYEKPDSQPQPQLQPQAYPWGHDAMGSQFSAPYSDSFSHLASINPFNAHANAQTTSPPNPNPNSNSLFQIPPAPPPINQHQHHPHPHHHQHQLDPLQRELTPNPIDSIPDSWKIEGKEELLETLLQTISSCDEKSVAQVVSVVRASATPEAAVSGICQVLGISGISGQ